MTKDDLVRTISEEAGITKKAAFAALAAIIKSVHDSLGRKDGRIHISNLGAFSILHRRVRAGVNPQTGEKIKIPAMLVPRFSPSKSLKDTVKKSK
jgi:DNA-binding protein HU-beta